MSFWTKRRRVIDQVNQHIDDIVSFDSCFANDEQVNEEAGQAEVLSENIDTLTDSESNAEVLLQEDQQNQDFCDQQNQDFCANLPVGDIHVDTESDDEMFQVHVNTDPLHDSEANSESDSEDEETECENDFNLKICNWAVSHNITFAALKDLLQILRESDHHSLPKDPRTLMKTGKVDGIKAVGGGWYYHFGIKETVLAQLSGLKLDDLDESPEIRLHIGIDGVPLFRSSNTQFWPILGLVIEPQRSGPFIIGLFSGNEKPKSVGEYMEDFVAEMEQIQASNGLYCDGKMIRISVSAFICDAPARAFVKQVKGHSGYCACEKCTTHGIYRTQSCISRNRCSTSHK